MCCIPIKILRPMSIKPTAVEHFVIDERVGEETVGKGDVKTMVLTRKGESLASGVRQARWEHLGKSCEPPFSHQWNQIKSCSVLLPGPNEIWWENGSAKSQSIPEMPGTPYRIPSEKNKDVKKSLKVKAYLTDCPSLDFIWSQQFSVLIFLMWSVCLANCYSAHTTISTWRGRISAFPSSGGQNRGLPVGQAGLKLSLFLSPSIGTEAPQRKIPCLPGLPVPGTGCSAWHFTGTQQIFVGWRMHWSSSPLWCESGTGSENKQ